MASVLKHGTDHRSIPLAPLARHAIKKWSCLAQLLTEGPGRVCRHYNSMGHCWRCCALSVPEMLFQVVNRTACGKVREHSV